MGRDSEHRPGVFWSYPESRDGRPVLRSFVEQISGDKNSCYLASVLNALIARGVIEPELGAELHQRLVSDPRNKDLWMPRGKKPQNWSSNPRRTVQLLREVAALEVNFSTKQLPPRTSEADIVLGQILDEGFAIVGDDGQHAVVVIRPEGSPPDYSLIVDPLRVDEHNWASASTIEAYFRRGEGILTVF